MRAVAVLSVLAVFFLSACTCEEAGVSIGANPSGGGETTLIKLQVEGMACGVMCPPKIRDDLLTVKGVEDVKVDFETKTATVKTSVDVESAALVKSLRKQFTATVQN
ncbi:MAG: heavy metal-associated domain-containing protein [Planctomycetota bacterium]|nr:heavy metal-associated domain-containing protein [Planctomycetota bacterium]